MSERHKNLIEQLGGGTEVATAVFGGIGPGGKFRDRVYKWARNGIPWKFRPAVADLARQRGVEPPDDFFISAANDTEAETASAA